MELSTRCVGILATLFWILLLGACPTILSAQDLPPGFDLEIAFSGLNQPTNIEFAADGRVFVAEKGGVIRTFDDVSDPTSSVFADLSVQVMDYWERGLLGLAVHPNFPTEPYLYLLYTLDAPVGGTPPVFNDSCADPTGAGCVVGGRLSRLTASPSGETMVGSEEVLIEDWCQQFPSHSIGDLVFGLDGMLYVSAGDGASFGFVDVGQVGNRCGDPTGEGGALRSQDLRTPSDPHSYDGTVLRIDPLTGEAPVDNPLAGGAVSGDDAIIAYGLRNPFRATVHPVTGEIWLGDVGWGLWEEIDVISDPLDGVVENFGWPCYEGAASQGAYDGANIPLCESLYSTPLAHTPPHYAYFHSQGMPGSCGIGVSAISGLAFHVGGPYPPVYEGALFFSDYNRGCIWVMFADVNGVPDPGQVASFVGSAGGPVDLERGPDGSLYYVDLFSNTVRRVFSTSGPQFLRGDSNQDGDLNVADVIVMLEALFLAGMLQCLDAHDSNDDGIYDLSDPVYSLAFLFGSGAAPPAPFGTFPADCGVDPTPDIGGDLGCSGGSLCP